MSATTETTIDYRALADSVPGILWESEPGSLRYRYVSPAAERVLGYPLERWTGEADFWLAHLHAEDREWAPAYCEQATAERGEYQFHYRMIAADGRIVWLRDTVTVIAREGVPTRRIGVSVDVTSEREASDRLRARERHYRLLLDSTAEAICSVGPDNRCTYCNDAAVRVLGFERAGDILGRDMHSLIHHTRPDGSPYPAEQCPLREAVSSREGLRVDTEWLIRADGTYFPVSCASNPMIGDDGDLEGCVLTFRDITDDRRVHTELRRASAVFEYAAEGIFIADPELRPLAVNRAYTRMTGYALSDLGSTPPAPLASCSNSERFEREISPILQNEGLWEGELWGKRNDGEVHPYWLSLSAVRNDDGLPSQYIGLLSDIAELKQRQEQLQQLAHHDGLTGLPNRALFHDRLEQALAGARRSGGMVVIAFMDIDGFKRINDDYGHAAGDEALVEIGRRIAPVLRARDTLGRIGGDEFVLLFEDVSSADGARTAIDKALVEVAREPFRIGGHDHDVRLSVGIAQFPMDADDGNALLRCADSAMYRAKKTKGNSVEFYSR